jgi:2-polyprenyl-3-methyl-5-hydroxy-6-metoxy-1,4-benzoquinol methylase
MVTYFETVRTDIAPLLPSRATQVLDVGCGAGVTSRWLRSIYPDAEFVGLEGNTALSGQLSETVDRFEICDLNGEIPGGVGGDLILLLDVLEHLENPQNVANAFAERLAPGGTMIISLPNVAYYAVSLRLAILGRWEYQDDGVLDRTHRHFFTRKTARDLARQTGLTFQRQMMTGMAWRQRLIDRATLSLLQSRLGMQILVSLTKS